MNALISSKRSMQYPRLLTFWYKESGGKVRKSPLEILLMQWDAETIVKKEQKEVRLRFKGCEIKILSW